MAREIACLDRSGQQLRAANEFGNLPIINIKARCFLDLGWLNNIPPLRTAERFERQDAPSANEIVYAMPANTGGKEWTFVWIDQPELIVEAVRSLI